MSKPDVTVGQTLFMVEAYSSSAKARDVTVTAVGRKYITVVVPPFTTTYRFIRDTWQYAEGNYSGRYILFPSREVYERRMQTQRLRGELAEWLRSSDPIADDVIDQLHDIMVKATTS